MNLDQILSMIGRIFLRKAVNWGIRKGVDTVSRRSGGTAASPPPSPAASQAARDAAKRARKAAQIARRLGR